MADRWLASALNTLLRQLQLLAMLESDEIDDGATIRLADDSAEHTHLRRALEQRLPHLRNALVPAEIEAVIRRYISGETLVEAAGGGDRRDIGQLAAGDTAHLEHSDQAPLAADVD